MRFQSRKHHIIDILFPISLYFVFTVSALTVLLLATNVYRTTTENSALNFNANTSIKLTQHHFLLPFPALSQQHHLSV